MKILLYSKVFHPSVGGIETITATLAENYQAEGCEPVVVTETACLNSDDFPYSVVRKPKWREKLKLCLEADVIHSNGASIAMVPYAIMARKPFVWTHNGYQVMCVDGLGWNESGATPMTPVASVWFHINKFGFASGLNEGCKLLVRRLVAHYYAINVAATKWVAYRQPLPRQVVLYTPYPLGRFKHAPISRNDKHFEFIFVGRLVNEKGVETLIRAMSKICLNPSMSATRLAIVGSGPLREKLETMVHEMKLSHNVTFYGSKSGAELRAIVCSALIGVVPSAYEEPMGGVALELLASGRCVIVAKRGGIAECIGEAGLVFENGSDDDLADKMASLLQNEKLMSQCLAHADNQITQFDEKELSLRYLSLYKTLV